MKKVIDLLLVLLLFAVAAYVVFFAGSVSGGNPSPGPAASETSAPALPLTTSPAATFVPTDIPTATLIPASVTVPTKTVTPSPTHAPTATPTLTATVTPTPSITPTKAPTPSALEQEINGGIDQGNIIIKAIEAYRSAQGVYPRTLDLLVPGYLTRIPFTTSGRPFFYRLFDTTGPMAPEVYWLAFKVERTDHLTCTYLRRLDYWDCDFASP